MEVNRSFRLGGSREACHRSGTAGRIHHRHVQLDDVFLVVPQPANTIGRGSDGLAARWSGLPGGAGIGDRRSGCGHLLLSVIAAVDDESGAGYERCLLRTAHRATCLFPRLRASG